MIKRLTAVPMDIVPIMAIDNGFCSSDPISEENSNGTMAKIVVSEVMIIGRMNSFQQRNACLAQFIDRIQFQDRVIDYNTTGHNQTDGRHQIQRMPAYPEQ